MTMTKEQLLEQKRELVEQAILLFRDEVRSVMDEYERHKKVLLELPKQRAAIERARTFYERWFGNSEGTTNKLNELENSRVKPAWIVQVTVPKLIRQLEAVQADIFLLNAKGFYLEDPFWGRRKSDGFNTVFAEWCALKEKQQDTFYYNSVMAGCAIAFVATLTCALYAIMVGALVAGVLTGAFVYELRNYGAHSIPEEMLDELEEAMSETDLKAQLPELSFFKAPIEEQKENNERVGTIIYRSCFYKTTL